MNENANSAAPPRAYSYLRFSTPEQMRGDSFRRQSTLAAEYARRHALTLDTELTFNDLGVSAFRGRNAETGRLGDFLAAVEDGIVPPGSSLLVESLDRISRRAARRALRVLETIVDRGVTVVTLNDGRAYTNASLDEDPMSLMLALLTFIRANEESVTKARRLSAAWSSKRAKAADKPLTSVCPAWLRLDPASNRFALLPDRAEIVRRVFEEALAGRGQHAIAEGLNRDGVPVFGHRGRKGLHWHRSYIVKLLSNPAVVGTMTPHRIEHVAGKKRRVPLDPVPNYFPAVVPEDAFPRVQAMQDGARQPLRGRHAGGTVANILGGLARCPLCGGSMTLSTKGGNWRYLVCSRAKARAGCRYQAVRYGDVEGIITRHAGEIVADAPSGNAEAERLAGEMATLEASLAAHSDQLETLLDTAAHRSSRALAERIAEVEAEIATERVQLAELDARRAALVPARWAARLDDFERAATADPIDRQAVNAALRVLLTGVVVNFPAGDLEFHWKHGGWSRLPFAWVEEVSAETAAKPAAPPPPQGGSTSPTSPRVTR